MQKPNSDNVLITGGAGFIGSHLVESLGKTHKISIIDNLSTGKRKNLKNILKNKNVSFQVSDLSRLSARQLGHVNSVFHLAARSDVKESMEHPELYFKYNVSTTANLLEMMRKSDVSKIIFTSSSVVYGQSTQTHKEDSQTNPISIYGTTKQICESIIDSYCKMYGFKGVILRLANIVGPRSPKGIIHDMISKFEKNPKKILILGDGNQTKSYLHVYDCIDAITKCYANLNKQSQKCEIYNITNSDFLKVNQVVKAIGQIMNLKDFQARYQKHDKTGAGWKGDITIAKLDMSKIKRLGWSPRFNSIDAVQLATREIIQ